MHRLVHFFIALKTLFLIEYYISMRKKGFLFLSLYFCIAIGVANGADRFIQNNGRGIESQSGRTLNTIKTNTTKSRSGINTINTISPKTTKTSQSGITVISRPKASTNQKRVVNRAATTTFNSSTSNFVGEYESCRDTYFTCMDQFCANVDETYRRCVCSSRLTEIKKKQSSLATASDSISGFRDLNLDVVNKSADEVRAMMSATVGEQMATNAHDRSDSAQQLDSISDVLAKRRDASSANSTGGVMDIGGDIKSIWATTDIASGADIATLTGPALYNAVHAQCIQMVKNVCPSNLLSMVTSAYGMYIENDCATLSSGLNKQKNTADATIRETGRDLNVARLENYNAHNSLSINDCIKSIRQDLTQNTACGTDYVHCLDVTGLYLNIDTGEPIYTKNFFNLDNQISLSGNILENRTNSAFVQLLNRKQMFAKNSLDKCRDLSGSIWNEFMRQAIIEIHQKQQEKTRQVKTECLGVVNQCYDDQTRQLSEFTNIDEKTFLGLRLEATEDMCREKLNTCSNLYGGGPNGLLALVDAMHDIVDQKIIAECQSSLLDFTKSICSVHSTDTTHMYPYGCRTYIPGEQRYAKIPTCNSGTIDTTTCGDYAGSLYQRLANYAMQVCVRPSVDYNNEIPTLVLQDINIVMDKIRIAMNQVLSAECETYGGTWVATPYNDTSISLQETFYTDTDANKQWGYCKTVAQEYVITLWNQCEQNPEIVKTITAQIGSSITLASVYIPNDTTPCSSDPDHEPKCGYYTGRSGSGTKYFDKDGVATKPWDIPTDTTLYWFTGDSSDYNSTCIY